MSGFGGVLSFGLRFTDAQTRFFLESLELCTLAVSLGGTKTLIESPALMSHAQGGPDHESLAFVPANTVRLSVGLEGAEDIIRDLTNGITKAKRAA
jgi:methionine-gamma-lyase